MRSGPSENGHGVKKKSSGRRGQQCWVRFCASYWFKFERRPFKKRFTYTDIYLYKTVAHYLVAEGHFKYAKEKYNTRVWNSYTWFKNETEVICSRLFGE